jgi:hypothetical protein
VVSGKEIDVQKNYIIFYDRIQTKLLNCGVKSVSVFQSKEEKI